MSETTTNPTGEVVDELRLGNLKVTEWRNDNDHSVTLTTFWKKGDGFDHRSMTLWPRDLRNAARLLDTIADRIVERSARQPDADSGGATEPF